ncbi:MAG: mycofactocin biosynthesis peptidyl-dipeptidase MftE [Marmoricola sp.]
MRTLAEATWTDLPELPLVLVPVGSTEQHGPHLPLETDTVIATAVARVLADNMGGYVTPALSIGASGEHQGFPGTLSLGTEVLRSVLVELVRSMSLWAGRIVLVNGHGGNLDAVRQAVDQLVLEQHRVTWVPCTFNGDAHAGKAETSLMMHLAPWLVRRGRLQPGNTTPLTKLMPELAAHGVRAVSTNGVLGDPTRASAAEGGRLFARMVLEAQRGL